MEALSGFIANLVRLIIQPLIVLTVTAGVAYFIFMIAQYSFSSDKPEGRKKLTQQMMWGLAGILIMVGVIGILQVVLGTFGCSISNGITTC